MSVDVAVVAVAAATKHVNVLSVLMNYKHFHWNCSVSKSPLLVTVWQQVT